MTAKRKETRSAENERERSRRRSRRKRAVRGSTIVVRKMTMLSMAVGAAQYPEGEYLRPKTRGECAGGARPCPYVMCKHNLYVDVKPNGSIKVNFPDLDPGQMGESCSLDIADQGGATLEQVGDTMNMTRERARQIENVALGKLERKIGYLE